MAQPRQAKTGARHVRDSLSALKLDMDGLRTYSGTDVYILDGGENKRVTLVTEDDEAKTPVRNSGRIMSQHDQKVELMARTFASNLDAKVMKISFSKNDCRNNVATFFKKEFKKSDSFKILYFHGKAGRNGEDYTWKFTGPNSLGSDIKAYKVIGAIVESGADCLIICDCYVPSRFHNRWPAGDGTVTILGRGEEALDEEKNIVNGHDFTQNLADLIANVKRTGYRTRKRPFTLNQLLGRASLYSNPKVVHIRGYVPPGRRLGRADPLQLVTQGVMVPEHIKATGKITFFAKIIQYEEKYTKEKKDGGLKLTCSEKAGPHPNVHNEEHDEGFAEN